MESNTNRTVFCDSCLKAIELESIRLETEIVNKKLDGCHFVAVRYYFLCPYCGQRYVCFYKDAKVNLLFDQGRIEEAQERMEMLYEVFEEE